MYKYNASFSFSLLRSGGEPRHSSIHLKVQKNSMLLLANFGRNLLRIVIFLVRYYTLIVIGRVIT